MVYHCLQNWFAPSAKNWRMKRLCSPVVQQLCVKAARRENSLRTRPSAPCVTILLTLRTSYHIAFSEIRSTSSCLSLATSADRDPAPSDRDLQEEPRHQALRLLPHQHQHLHLASRDHLLLQVCPTFLLQSCRLFATHPQGAISKVNRGIHTPAASTNESSTMTARSDLSTRGQWIGGTEIMGGLGRIFLRRMIHLLPFRQPWQRWIMRKREAGRGQVIILRREPTESTGLIGGNGLRVTSRQSRRRKWSKDCSLKGTSEGERSRGTHPAIVGSSRERELLEIGKAVLNQMRQWRGKELKKQTDGRRENQFVERQETMKIKCGWGSLLPHSRLRLANPETRRERMKSWDTMIRI